MIRDPLGYNAPMRISTAPRALAGLLALLLAATAAPALAQELTPAQIERARSHFAAARAAETQEKWDDAVREYIAAYEVTRDPKLFFQIARCYENAGKTREALVFYRRYLNEETGLSAAAQQEVRDKIATLQGKPAATASPPPAPTPGAGTEAPEPDPAPDPADPGDDLLDDAMGPPPAVAGAATLPPEEPDASWYGAAAWTSVGVAALFLTSGGVLAMSASSRADDMKRLTSFRDPSTGLPRAYVGSVREQYEDAEQSGERFERLARIAFVGAGVATAAAITFFVLDATSADDEEGALAGARVAPWVAPGAAGVAAGFSF
jgi:tetratricopeptide (TPR) repeat protein